MMKFKNLFKRATEAKHALKDEKLVTNAIMENITFKRFFIYSTVTNIGAALIILGFYNYKYPELSIGRWVSRQTGRIGEIKIPKFMRKFVYNRYISMYSVNKEEMIEQNLESYENIKDFFTRKIDMTKRPIEDKSEDILSSPCDGRILSISEIENFDDLIIVKNKRYSLLKFLFGEFTSAYPELVESVSTKGKKYYQITIYLSPGDCHRYYSPNDIQVSSRTHIPGFLEPVRPSYLNKHPDALLNNERVTLQCGVSNTDDKLFITFVGALNVGSINLSFDEFLKTNQIINKDNLGLYFLKYSDLLSSGSNTKKYLRKEKIYYKPPIPLIMKEIENELEEFDIRDMIESNSDKVATIAQTNNLNFENVRRRLILQSLFTKDSTLEHNTDNNFNSLDVDLYKIKKKLKDPKELNIEKFKVSENGIHIKKGEEIGWFNFGSTIVLIFSKDEDKQIKFKYNSGDVVKIGQSLYDITEGSNNKI
jgi:phosphatidylserine decarboxylase